MKVFATSGKNSGTNAKSKANEFNANANRNRSGVARLTTPISRGSASGNPLRNRKSK